MTIFLVQSAVNFNDPLSCHHSFVTIVQS